MRMKSEQPIHIEKQAEHSISPERSRMLSVFQEAAQHIPALAACFAMATAVGPDQVIKPHKAETVAEPTVFEGFEAMDIDPVVLREYFELILPAKWLDSSHLSRIQMSPERSFLALPGLEDKTKVAQCRIFPDGRVPQIEIVHEEFKDLDGEYALRELLTTVAVHEAIHANDWKTSKDLTPKDAAKLHALIRALRSGPHKMDFVESGGIVQKPGHSVESTEDLKDTEYFAEFMPDVLQVHSGYPQVIQTQDEFKRCFGAFLEQIKGASAESARAHTEAALWYLSKVAPSFDLLRSLSLQEGAREKVITRYRLARAKRFIASVPDPLLRDVLGALLHSHEEAAMDVVHHSDVSADELIERAGVGHQPHVKEAVAAWGRIVKHLRAIREDAVWERETAESLTVFSKNLHVFVEGYEEAVDGLSDPERKKVRSILLRALTEER